ncbi:MAG TPA: hypothetical protein VFG22_01945, partial [Polyangiales bacterium]|nr:hypothetical protein [Polyangiales bacterium]
PPLDRREFTVTHNGQCHRYFLTPKEEAVVEALTCRVTRAMQNVIGKAAMAMVEALDVENTLTD